MSPRPRVNETGFPKANGPCFSSPYPLFVNRLWTCLLAWVQTTYESACVCNTDPEWNCRNYAGISQVSVEDIALVCTKFLKNSPRIVFSLNSTLASPLNFRQNATNFRSNIWVFTHEKNQTVSHTNEPSFQPWQWRIKNYLPIFWDESTAQTSAKTQ